MMKQAFRDVYVVKPESSRALSAEAFVVGIGFLPNANLTLLSDSITVLSAAPSTASQTPALTQSQHEEEQKDDDDKLTF